MQNFKLYTMVSFIFRFNENFGAKFKVFEKINTFSVHFGEIMDKIINLYRSILKSNKIIITLMIFKRK